MTTFRLGRNVIRPALVGAAVLLVLILSFRVIAPVLISSALVRDQMESAVEAWLGHDVVIDGTPQLQFWPRPLITMPDLTIRQEDRDGAEVLGQVASLSARFSLLDALWGAPTFRDFTLTGPDITIRLNAEGRFNWSSNGLLGLAVHRAAADEPLTPDETATVIGDVTILDGRLHLYDQSDHALLLEAVNGSLIWPTLGSAAQVKISAQVKGQTVNLDLSSPQPMQLLGGRTASLTAGVSSALLSGSFDGTADLATYAFFSGALSLTIPKFDALTRWTSIPVHTADRLTDLSLTAQLATMGNVLRFDTLKVKANGTQGHGVMDLVMASGDAPPRVTGTLAFDRLDLWTLVTALCEDLREPEGQASEAMAAAARHDRQLGLDVRFSASEARLGSLSLSNAAVSVLSGPERTQIEILDSDLLTGSLTAQLQMQSPPQKTLSSPAGQPRSDAETVRGLSSKVRLSVRGVNLASLAGPLGLTGPTIDAPASLDLALSTQGLIIDPLGQDIAGTVKLTASGGEIRNLDLAQIRSLSANGTYFSLDEASGDNTVFDTLTLEAKIAAGSAELQTADLESADQRLSLSGVIAYLSRSLALSARLSDPSNAQPPLDLFIGGAWPNPVIWPVTPESPSSGRP
ncbi:AsmA-like C-terminal region-containing protein [Rhizobium sp. SSA_523]|uniref:AsmA family protein n=1 Tax=Rhizobium sp. SSA_523 TaxID=2952477 RepID=UPI0020918F29|nr:AsmA-like C-terminal region-containing protein [Rhizobium sp. SSA_523]MCO5733074.1 hypothetical protein [Rhizobium sp. SSA_523]WKC23953.1 AsmA-like C-terminal region-containing protein [Rhizobium sp. SSA_523]